MRAVDQAVNDRIGERRVVQVLMPVLDRELTSEERCSGSDAIVEEFEQIVALARPEGTDRKIGSSSSCVMRIIIFYCNLPSSDYYSRTFWRGCRCGPASDMVACGGREKVVR